MSGAYRDGTYANILGGQLFIPSHLGKMAQDFIFEVWTMFDDDDACKPQPSISLHLAGLQEFRNTQVSSACKFAQPFVVMIQLMFDDRLGAPRLQV